MRRRAIVLFVSVWLWNCGGQSPTAPTDTMSLASSAVPQPDTGALFQGRIGATLTDDPEISALAVDTDGWLIGANDQVATIRAPDGTNMTVFLQADGLPSRAIIAGTEFWFANYTPTTVDIGTIDLDKKVVVVRNIPLSRHHAALSTVNGASLIPTVKFTGPGSPQTCGIQGDPRGNCPVPPGTGRDLALLIKAGTIAGAVAACVTTGLAAVKTLGAAVILAEYVCVASSISILATLNSGDFGLEHANSVIQVSTKFDHCKNLPKTLPVVVGCLSDLVNGLQRVNQAIQLTPEEKSRLDEELKGPGVPAPRGPQTPPPPPPKAPTPSPAPTPTPPKAPTPTPTCFTGVSCFPPTPVPSAQDSLIGTWKGTLTSTVSRDATFIFTADSAGVVRGTYAIGPNPANGYISRGSFVGTKAGSTLRLGMSDVASEYVFTISGNSMRGRAAVNPDRDFHLIRQSR